MRGWTSDFHMGHYNVIKYCNRPFKDISHMHETIIERWNTAISPDDEMWFLGDWSMSQRYLWMLNRFNFKNMVWVLGNHDKEKRIIKEMEEGGILYDLRDKITLRKGTYVNIGGKMFTVVHRPMDGGDEYPVLCGHVHERWQFLPPGTSISEHGRSKPSTTKVLQMPILNVGVDVNNFFPYTDEQILKFFENY